MKRLTFAAIFLGILALAGTGWALTIDGGGIQIGDVDNLQYWDVVDNAWEAELAWVQSVLGEEYYFDEDYKYESDDPDWDWYLADGTDDIWAFELATDPGYFFIKIGTGSLPEGTADHYLFENVLETDWAVVDLSDILATFPPFDTGAPYEGNISVTRISHLGEVGGTQVPEPGSLLLLGVGMVGIAGLRRKLS